MSSNIAAEIEAVPEPTLTYVTSCDLPTPWATFRLHAFVEAGSGREHLAMALGDVADGEPVLARIHSECLTGDALFSQRCDCGTQLETALKKIALAGRGIVLYMRQEGRGIGLIGKLRAYHLQDDGADTVEANQALGFEPDQRNYRLCLPMLQQLSVSSLQLMTNNPRKIDALQQLGIVVSERIALHVNVNKFNLRYLQTKASKLGHIIDF
ncbi:MAG: GTP cyclohydrolase II [Pseudomonadota bacterium]